MAHNTCSKSGPALKSVSRLRPHQTTSNRRAAALCGAVCTWLENGAKKDRSLFEQATLQEAQCVGHLRRSGRTEACPTCHSALGQRRDAPQGAARVRAGPRLGVLQMHIWETMDGRK
ncbi:hypothetical protein Bbelb_101710 [Branchiostoma belcheri]|nr:hypothetical protein Bbelb_101710 [Branchiostoma belcheri]